MAKFNRHDPRNKKASKHKNQSKFGKDKRIKRVKSDDKQYKELFL
jgi:hypothetical protein